MSAALARLRPLDWILVLNISLFAVMVVLFYWDRFIAYRRSANLLEFFLYACFYVVFVGWLWFKLRKLPVRWALLIVGEAGLLLHFAGGVRLDAGQRLYDVVLLHWGDFRFDKIVHVIEGVVAGLASGAIIRAYSVRLGRLRVPVMMLIIVGLGALWEIAEYLVLKTVPGSGVGGYDNNMQDMIANFAGAGLYLMLPERWRAACEDAPPDAAAPAPGVSAAGPGGSAC